MFTRFNGIRKIYNEYPSQFWVLVLGTFIDRLGGALLFPFFTLYLTSKFSIGMIQVGIIFALFSISSVIGSMFGGALADRMGRKGMLLFGLIASALSSLLMGVIDQISWFYFVTVFVGILSNAGGPAQQAMVADLLPEEKLSQGFGILRVVVNLAVTIGPLIGGLLAAQSFLLLFISDAVTSMITAAIVFLVLQETRQPKAVGEPEESLRQTFAGYRQTVHDSAFVWFLAASMLMVVVYMQMNTTLAVYLRDVHGINARGFGYILSLNAAMVVLFQFPVTRWVSKYRPLVIMAAGTLLYALGFGIYGFASLYWIFLLAMVIITIGEMMVSPVGQAIAASLAPQNMRGRYMAVFGFSWVIPTAVGPLFAGLVMDHFNPDWVWYFAGFIGIIAAGAYYFLEVRVGRSRWDAVEERLVVLQKMEDGELTADEAARKLEKIGQGVWSRLAPQGIENHRRNLRIRINDIVSGTMKSDLQIPIGLATMVLDADGLLSAELGAYDQRRLSELISESQNLNRPRKMNAGSDEIEITIE